ncbi:MAG: prepilin peptidase [Actinobacteria bacterium]|nr:prepilin peptidase [Actinomycetota bacterium]
MFYVAIVLVVISIVDLRTHIIPNVSVLVLSLLLYIFQPTGVRIFASITFLLISLSLVKLVDIGGGDIKLITALIAFAHPGITVSTYLWESLWCALVLILLHRFFSRNWSGNIALGPAICVPFLITLL